MDNQSIDNVIVSRLASEIGTLKVRVIQVEAYNEVFVKRIKELENELESLSENDNPASE